MFQKFFTKTIESKFIKNLLYNTPLPHYKSVRSGDYLIKDIKYIYKDMLIKCTQSGYLNKYYWDVYSLANETQYYIDSTSSIGSIDVAKVLNSDHQKIYISNYIIKNVEDNYTLPRNSESTVLDLSTIDTLDIADKFIRLDGSTTIYAMTSSPKIYSSVDLYNGKRSIFINITGAYETYNLTSSIEYKIPYEKDSKLTTVSEFSANKYPSNGMYNNHWYLQVTNTDICTYEKIDNYIFGKNYPQLTEKFISKYGYYDSETHKVLGDYLRYIKNIYDLDLMPFYNCYNNSMVNNLSIIKQYNITSDFYGSIELPSGRMLGDLNGDGVINESDQEVLKQIRDQKRTPTAIEKYVGDINNDGTIDDKDLELLKSGTYLDLPYHFKSVALETPITYPEIITTFTDNNYAYIVSASSVHSDSVTKTIYGDGVTSTFNVTHDLNTKDVVVQIYDENYNTILVDSTRNLNSIDVIFNEAPAVGTQYTILICISSTSTNLYNLYRSSDLSNWELVYGDNKFNYNYVLYANNKYYLQNDKVLKICESINNFSTALTVNCEFNGPIQFINNKFIALEYKPNTNQVNKLYISDDAISWTYITVPFNSLDYRLVKNYTVKLSDNTKILNLPFIVDNPSNTLMVYKNGYLINEYTYENGAITLDSAGSKNDIFSIYGETIDTHLVYNYSNAVHINDKYTMICHDIANGIDYLCESSDLTNWVTTKITNTDANISVNYKLVKNSTQITYLDTLNTTNTLYTKQNSTWTKINVDTNTYTIIVNNSNTIIKPLSTNTYYILNDTILSKYFIPDTKAWYGCIMFNNNLVILPTNMTDVTSIVDVANLSTRDYYHIWNYDTTNGYWYTDITTEIPAASILLYLSWLIVYAKDIDNTTRRVWVKNVPTETHSYSIGSSEIKYTFTSSSNSSYKILSVPIKFNQTYTIALDADCDVAITPAVIKDDRLMQVYTANKSRIDLTEAIGIKPITKTTTRFNYPFTYKVDLTDSNQYAKYLSQNEDYLVLLLQLPISVSSSIVVLEGDYTEIINGKKYYDDELFSTLTPPELDSLFISKLSLLKMNDKNTYAFSDKLIEYLTLNVINSLETIDDNIIYVQDANNLFDISTMGKGVWTADIRRWYYNNIMNNTKVEHYDLDGYIDRIIEHNCIS